MIVDAYQAIVAYIEQGGNVLYLIAIVTFLMWSLLFERLWYFRREHDALVREAQEMWVNRQDRRSWSAAEIRSSLISQASEQITGSLPVIQTCVTLCPLLGLLGTVTGMITVFDAMATQGGNARSMAAGVSMATIPTMSGMIAALSGLVGTTIIRRKINTEIAVFEQHLVRDY